MAMNQPVSRGGREQSSHAVDNSPSGDTFILSRRIVGSLVLPEVDMSSRMQCALIRDPLLTSKNGNPLISTMTLGISFIFGTFAVISCCSVCKSQENGSEHAKQKPFVIKLANPTFSTVEFSANIGSIERGKATTVPLRFENNVGGNITFREVAVQCSCTGARIPDDSINPGQSLDGDIKLTVSKNERALSKVFSFEIKTLGSIDRILVDLKANVSNIVAFSQELYSVSVDSSVLEREKVISLTFPFIASPDVKLDELRVSVSGSLYEKSGKSIAAEFKSFSEQEIVKGVVGAVVIQVDPKAFKSDSEYFAVHVEGRYFPAETAQVALRRKRPVSFFPEDLNFSSTDLINVQAFGIIRVANTLDASALKVISAKLDTGDLIDSRLLSSGNTVARLELTCSKEQASKWKNSTRELEIIVECEGKRFALNARCHFQW